MGGNQSARKLQIDNDSDPSTVITVSEKVVQRIRSGGDKENQQPNPVKAVRSITPNDDINSSLERFQNGIPFVTAKMIRQEIEHELQKNNQYWENRLLNLQKNHEKINLIMEQEYIRSVEQIKKELPSLPPENAVIPCQDKKGNVIKCYKMYSKKPLLCAQEVQEFNCCLKDTRVKLLSQK